MNWDYRIVKYWEADGDEAYGLHEVYYTETGKARMMTVKPCGFVGLTPEDLKASIQMALDDAFSKPIFEEPEEWYQQAATPIMAVGDREDV